MVVPANTVLTPGASIFILECAAPGGVDPSGSASCDGNTGYQGGTVSVDGDGSIDVMDLNTSYPDTTINGAPYTVYALPDGPALGEAPTTTPKCGLGSANECVLYIGEGGGGDTGFSQPHFFSQAFQVHPDPTDSGTLNPGDGTFPADSAPGAISTANHVTFTKGTAGSFSISATGYGPPAYTETGVLPSGVSLKTTYSGVTSTGVLAGTPTQSGTFPITITANNGVGTPTTQAFTLTVDAAPAITSANNYSLVLGNSPSFTATATGFPAPTFSDPGPLDGLTIGTNGALTGTATTTGTFTSTITASNGVGTNATQSFTLTVSSTGVAPHITSANNYTLVLGNSPSFSATATGTPAPTFSDPGPLDGLSMGTNGALTGTATASGTFASTITATNGIGTPGSQTFTLTIDAVPVITSADSYSFIKGSSPNFTVTASGYPAPTFSDPGPLDGLSINATTGALTGTPTTTGSFASTITASNGVGTAPTQSFTLTVNSAGVAPTITSADATSFSQGAAGSFTVTATGNSGTDLHRDRASAERGEPEHRRVALRHAGLSAPPAVTRSPSPPPTGWVRRAPRASP